jgi:hypothetical protein
MRLGTRSLLYGVHQVGIHPWFVAWATGELREYMQGPGARTPAGDRTARQWYRDVRRYCTAWALEHRDGRADTWTGTRRDLAIDGSAGGGRGDGRRA